MEETMQKAPKSSAGRSGFDWDSAMAASMAGDRVTYRQLLEQSARWLQRFYARRVPADMVDDLVQETLIAIHTRLANFTPGRPYLPWLVAIARYKWIDALRSGRRHHAEELVDAEAASHESDVVSGLSLGRLLAGLRTGQAEAIRLVKLEGRSIREASTLSGQSESLVKVNIHRGILAMRSMLGGETLAHRYS
jgi:RNA polymerase sigma-70 factor (ECF subfamily)